MHGRLPTRLQLLVCIPKYPQGIAQVVRRLPRFVDHLSRPEPSFATTFRVRLDRRVQTLDESGELEPRYRCILISRLLLLQPNPENIVRELNTKLPDQDKLKMPRGRLLATVYAGRQSTTAESSQASSVSQFVTRRRNLAFELDC